MKVQVRRSVFETNSSSTHSISIIKKSNITEFPDTVVFGKGEFGWDFDIHFDTTTKAQYIWEAITSCYRTNIDKVNNAIKSITDILAKHNIKAVFPYADHMKVKVHKYDDGSEYTYIKFMNNDDEEDSGYVDHGNELGDFLTDIISDEKKLMNYLFDYNSYVSTGNDNSDEELDCPNFGKSWEYYKSN